jgi:hypothetical protein
MTVPGSLYTPTIRKTRASAYLLEQSLLFNDGDSAFLNRTPSTAGNRKTWTYSVWLKRTEDSVVFFQAGVDSANWTQILFSGTDTINFQHQVSGGGYESNLATTASFSDYSAWYHIVISVDTTLATAADRIKIYVNGIQQTLTITTQISQNTDTFINSTNIHRISSHFSGAYYDGLMALPILVDGTALAPTAFGETDNDGFWNPIEFTGATTTDANYSATVTAPNFGTDAEAILGSDGDKTTIYDVQPGALAGVATSGRIAIKMDFGTAVTVTMAAISAKITAGSGFQVEIYYSSDDSTWTQFNSTYANLTSSYQDFATTGSQSARYWAATFSAGNHGSQTVTISDFRVFTDNASSFGTNGFQLDYADTGYFGKDVATAHTAIGATYRATAVSTANASSYTFSSQAIGTADDNRYVIVAVHLQRSNTSEIVNSLSVGGVSATLISSGTSNTANRSLVDFWKAAVPTGTTADVVVTLSAAAARCAISVWSCIGNVQKLQSVIAAPSNASTNVLLTTTQVPDNGFALSGVAWQSSSNGTDNQATFANTTERVDATFGEVDASYAAASADFTSASVLGISCTSQLSAGSVYYAVMNTTSFVPAGMNSYASNNFTASDQLEDTPTDSADDGIGNFATWNALKNDQVVLSEGNLNTVGQTAMGNILSTIPITAGMKIAFEVEIVASDTNVYIGMWKGSKADTTFPPTYGLDGDSWRILHSLGGNAGIECKYNGVEDYRYTASGDLAAGDKFHIEIDKDAGEVFVWINDGGGYVAFNSGLTVFDATAEAAIIAEDNLFIAHSIYQTAATNSVRCNFGQKAFDKTPTAGYTGLATQNLPAPTIADGSQHMNTVLYTANNTDPHAITGVGFSPDLVWLKRRDGTGVHGLFDSVRGVSKYLQSNATAAEATLSGVKSFDADGFTLGTGFNSTVGGSSMVGWCWKAGGAASSNSDGSITTSVSANPTAGFSIISYTGNATAGATLGHGLSSAPKFIICKNRDNGANNWGGYHVSLGGTHRIFLDNNNAAQDDDGNWNDTNPTASVITLGNGGITNSNTDDFIMYAWAEVEGFSKFGSYTGNANVDGPFIYLGFRPAFILEKRTDSAGAWYITDMTRDTYNPVNKYLMPDATNAEASGSTSSGVYLDALSNGYKIRGTSAGQEYNRSGTYIYMAFAEQPFQGAGGATQARAR